MPPEITWVRNSTRHGTRGIFHIALTPMEGTRLCDMKSRCGWKFGHIPTVVAGCKPPLPREFFFVCKRCGRAPRLALFEELATSLKKSASASSQKRER